MKILVADDDALSRSLMRRMLLQSGYEVVTAKDGAEAVKLMQSEDSPRLALLDWMMPELDGPSVCRTIRAGGQRAYTYMVLLTSRDSMDDVIAGLEAGADDYLTKPCHMDELRARLRTGQRILELEDSLVEAREQMRFRATHDALTQLFDHGAILQSLSDGLDQARRREKDMCILLCDIDHFKRINDSYGHPVGDEVLREVAHRLKNSVREGDAVGRYGGEEFLLLLRGCEARFLEARALHICNAIRSTPCQTTVGPLSITASVGAFSLPAHMREVTPTQLLHQADELLYRAKREGRNRAAVGLVEQSTLEAQTLVLV